MADDAVKTTEEISSEADSAWGRQLAKLFPVIKIMQVQVTSKWLLFSQLSIVIHNSEKKSM